MRAKLLIVAGALVLLGIVVFLLQPGEPEGECAPEGATATSGYVDDETGCPISLESWEEIRDYQTSPKYFRIAGLGLVIIGVAVGGVGLLRKDRSQGAEPSSGGPATDGPPIGGPPPAA